MSYVNWIEIYDDYSSAELDEEIARLKKSVAGAGGSYTGQTVGNKSYTRDTNMLQAQLQAAIRVRKARQSSSTGRQAFVGVADFSSGVEGSHPSSTLDSTTP